MVVMNLPETKAAHGAASWKHEGKVGPAICLFIGVLTNKRQ
jgi:hypothetical protein